MSPTPAELDRARTAFFSNLLEVKPQTKPEDVKRRIQSALVPTAETDAKNIQVDVQDGRVVLKGRVRSWSE